MYRVNYIQARSGQIRRGQTRPDQTRPDQTRPDQTRPDQTRPDQTPEQIRSTPKTGGFPGVSWLIFELYTFKFNIQIERNVKFKFKFQFKFKFKFVQNKRAYGIGGGPNVPFPNKPNRLSTSACAFIIALIFFFSSFSRLSFSFCLT